MAHRTSGIFGRELRREDYQGRPQTYVKHLFLKRYLYALAFKVLQAPGSNLDFLYIDGFSGPWKSTADHRSDTSFSIALTVLSDVARHLRDRGLMPHIRAIFVEKNRGASEELECAVAEFPLIESVVINGQFEECIPRIVKMVGGAFVFTFVDPTGWTGLALKKLAPLLCISRSEVLINMMAYSLTRHLELPSVQGGLEEYFGGPGWRERYCQIYGGTRQREEAFRQTYLVRLKEICNFRYVGTTRVRFGGQQRTYFYLVYGTRHPAGMEVFRDTERKAVEVQEDLAYGSVIGKASEGGRMADMLVGVENPNLGVFRAWESASRAEARAEFDAWLASGSLRREPDAAAHFMQYPHVDMKLVKAWFIEAEAAGRLSRRPGSRGGAVLVPTP
jgi:three-Cys-motif partner protein